MKMSFATTSLLAGVALIAATAPVSTLAATKSIAYHGFSDGARTAYLIDWLPHGRARVVAGLGAGPGTITDDGNQKTIGFDIPLSELFEDVDECGLPIQTRHEVRQLVVRNLPAAVTQFVELGARINVGGCQDGLEVPFGSPSDSGVSLTRLAMSARPPMDDIVPGTQIAGFSEEGPQHPSGYLAEDVVTLLAGNGQFHRSGNVVPAALDADKWLVFSFPGFQRAYTRLAIDAKTGGESWLVADWAADSPQRVQDLLVVKPAAGAGFGDVKRASRVWDSGMFRNSEVLRSATHLYKDGTGERVTRRLGQDLETRDPIDAWEFDGLNIVQQRSTADGQLVHLRTWMPLRNQGSKVRWVLEEETRRLNDEPFPGIKPRVTFYIDTGKAVPPASVKASH